MQPAMRAQCGPSQLQGPAQLPDPSQHVLGSFSVAVSSMDHGFLQAYSAPQAAQTRPGLQQHQSAGMLRLHASRLSLQQWQPVETCSFRA